MNDGYQKGRDDARDGTYPDHARQKWYRSGDRHYDDRYGSRQVYEDRLSRRVPATGTSARIGSWVRYVSADKEDAAAGSSA